MATQVTPGTVDISHFAAEEQQLSDLAVQWRVARTHHDIDQATALVHQYQQIAETMRQNGWDGKWLSADDMLPDNLMPPFLRG